MNSFLVPLFSLLPLTALAAPTQDLLVKIEESYNPKIEARVVDRGWSFYGCPTEDIEITGQDPITRQKRTVNLTLYRARTQSKNPSSVIILPPTGGVNILDRGYANEICSSGMNAALISEWDYQLPKNKDLEIHDQGALRALAATRHVVEFLRAENSSRIGLLGTSIGAIAGNLALGYEPRISSAALIAGSARFADVIAESDEAGAVDLRTHRMKLLGLKNQDEYRQVIHKAVQINPSSFINHSGLKQSLIVSADADTTVPSSYQFELAHLLQAEVHIRLKGDHLKVIKETFFQRRQEIVSFFKKSLHEKIHD